MNNQSNYVIGQRWLNHADPQLGLGIITAIEARRLEVSFPAVEDKRIFSISQAPLTRISFGLGDEIKTVDENQLTITDVNEREGIFYYTGLTAEGLEQVIPEVQLSGQISFNSPLERLFGGHIGRHRDFKLKIKTLNLLAKLYQSDSRGLIGARTEHIPHQLYIAHEVAKRHAPRVLLADEVGLGKTIEAGLIMHHQLITSRAKRVLIIVPQTLIHQWYIEMLRRFNLAFAIFDEQRYQAIEQDNPFDSEQLILTSLEFLMSDEIIAEQAQAADWDLVTVDEAHHLHWQEDNPSEEYNCIEQFALLCKGLLLLTATPEQLGHQSHFARLRLLDAARYQSLAAFEQEQQRYQEINDLVNQLVEHQNLDPQADYPPALAHTVSQLLGEDYPKQTSKVIAMLLDRYGTGRGLFRNTRSAVAGFPKRVVEHSLLDKPELYQQLATENISEMLHPELLVASKEWLISDPRVEWLIAKIRALRPQKVLVITANATTAIALEKHLRLKTHIRVSAFHEGLSVIERDRAAAYFAEQEEGAECLICSEIGSEGRNFQFAHHLILFDLPLNPDLLEQRIGRLDRIGQQQDITIHVPIIKDMPSAVLFDWYHHGLGVFERSCSFGLAIFEKYQSQLMALLEKPEPTVLQQLLDDTKSYTATMRAQAEAGRDRLLELNSCNKDQANALISAIEAEEEPTILQEYMAKVFSAYGIEHETHSEFTEILRASPHMAVPYFPCLKEEDELTVTYSRAKALIREDIEFLSFEHPMVREVMEMVLNDDSGTAVFCSMALPSLPQGALLLEIFYSVDIIAPEILAVHRYLPLTPIRVLSSEVGKNLAEVISHQQLSELCRVIKRHRAHELIGHIRGQVETMLDSAQQHAMQLLPAIKQTALAKAALELNEEVARLQSLKAVNPSIKQAEIDIITEQLKEIENVINNATLRQMGLRVVINMP